MSGASTVEGVMTKIGKSGVFPDDKGLMRRIAFVESKDGTDPNTNRPGYYGGIWQVDRKGFDDTKNVKSHPGLAGKYENIKNELGIDWPSVKWEDIRDDPLKSGLAARLFLSNIPGAIPSDVNGQAEYWKKHYNTAAGAGTVEKFKTDVGLIP